VLAVRDEDSTFNYFSLQATGLAHKREYIQEWQELTWRKPKKYIKSQLTGDAAM
jgi:hypothetical protein